MTFLKCSSNKNIFYFLIMYQLSVTASKAVGILSIEPHHCSKSIMELLISSVLYFFLLQQTYLQSLTIRLEEMRVKRRDSEQWMHHRLLPPDLRERVRRYDQYKWLETRGVDEESLVQSLPKDLRRDIKRHLCLALVKRVITLL